MQILVFAYIAYIIFQNIILPLRESQKKNSSQHIPPAKDIKGTKEKKLLTQLLSEVNNAKKQSDTSIPVTSSQPKNIQRRRRRNERRAAQQANLEPVVLKANHSFKDHLNQPYDAAGQEIKQRHVQHEIELQSQLAARKEEQRLHQKNLRKAIIAKEVLDLPLSKRRYR